MNYKFLSKASVVVLLTQTMFACTSPTQDGPDSDVTSDQVNTQTQSVTSTESETQTNTEVVIDSIDPDGIEVNGVFISAKSSQDVNVPENVYDNDESTRWSAESISGEPQWLQLAFSKPKTVAGLDIIFLKGDERATIFDIVVLEQDGSWTTVYSGQSAGLTAGFEYFDIENTTTTTVRVIGYGNSESDWNSISEIEIYFDEDKNDSATTTQTMITTQTQTQTQTATPTDTETNSNTGGLTGWDFSYWDLEGGDNDLDPVVNDSMVFDALAAQHITPNGNGWRHEYKIYTDQRVAMTEVYEDFRANIKVEMSPGSKTIVIQHHASDTGTIMKLYIADTSESGFDEDAGVIANSTANDGIFDVFVRILGEDSSEEKKLLGVIQSGEDFDFRVINDFGHVTVTAMGQSFDATVQDDSASYLKFGNYLQAQDAQTNEKVESSDDFAQFYIDAGITLSQLTFTNLSYERVYLGDEITETGTMTATDIETETATQTATQTETSTETNTNTQTDTQVDPGTGYVDDGDLIGDLDVENKVSTTVASNTGSVVVTGQTHYSSADDLSDLLAAGTVTGGDEIIITQGGEISIKEISFTSPVLIRAATIGSITLESVSLTNVNNMAFQGFIFGPNEDASTLFKIVNSTNIKVLRNVFDHLDVVTPQSSLIMTGESVFIEIAYNDFRDKNVMLNADNQKNTGSFIKYQYESENGLMTKNTHVHHNKFSNIVPYLVNGVPAGDSDREVLVMGIADSQDIVTNNVVEYNYFEDTDGENEIMTIKTSGNTFRYNTFVNAMGSLSFRLGHDNQAYGNSFYGVGVGDLVTDNNYQTGGIRTYGAGHRIHDNYMEGLTGTTWRLPLLIDNGDTSDSTNGDSHQDGTDVVIRNNTIVNTVGGGIYIGRADSNYKNSPTYISIIDNIVMGGFGIQFGNDSNSETNTWSGNIAYAIGNATAVSGGPLSSAEVEEVTSTPNFIVRTPLTPSDVGPNAD
ncbi:polysaccharide lyase family 7 protein [Marinicellulosiphila megalodicopiae]|uniref:polysaccharide lyase family 7 protein n=1 Tax=Marinicellulosiphila megalodicopiae TaxID=2724896 RepID=UPI003BB06C36